jgi:hypothetical protein
MSAWRRKAIELLPQHRPLIERAESPMSLWIDLRLRFLDHVASGEQAAERAVLGYASWCTAEGAGSGPSDTLTAALVAFYEDLASEKTLWPRFRDWFRPNEFEALVHHFQYHLSDQEFQQLREEFYGRRSKSGRSRVWRPMVQHPQETLHQLCAIFPAFEASWAEEKAPPEDGLVEGVYYEWSHHAVLRKFLEYFAMNHGSFSAKQLRVFGAWVNRAVSVNDDLENAVSTCFLEHARQVGIDRVLGPYLLSRAKDKSHP